jgi:dihydrofolate reductase
LSAVTTPSLALIAAVADNGVIGVDNRLPWHLPEDLRHFKRLTLGKPVIMGRRTYESIGRPLPGRFNIVVSRQAGLVIDGVEVVADLDAALALARDRAEAEHVDEIFVLGGAQLYALALPLAERLYLTEVHLAPAGDTLFPDWSREEWLEVSRDRRPATAEFVHPFDFVVYRRQ